MTRPITYMGNQDAASGYPELWVALYGSPDIEQGIETGREAWPTAQRVIDKALRSRTQVSTGHIS